MHKILIKTLVILGICLVCSQASQGTCLAYQPEFLAKETRDGLAIVGVSCIACHGDMSDVSDLARSSWVNLLACGSCHIQPLTKSISGNIDNLDQNLTPVSSILYQNSEVQSGSGIYCPACHGLPLAIHATITTGNHEQSIRYQGQAAPIIECEFCHIDKLEEIF